MVVRVKTQFRLKTLFALVTASAIGLWGYCVLWPALREYLLVQSLRRAVQGAATSAEAGKALAQLVHRARPERLRQLTKDSDASIALKAAFELQRDRESVDGYMTPAAASRFLAFFRERTGLDPPAWWAKHIHELYPDPIPQSLPIASWTEAGDYFIVRSKDSSVRVAKADVESAHGERFDLCTCLAHIEKDRAQLAWYDDDGDSFKLSSIDPHSSRLIWKADVWSLGTENLAGLEGLWTHAAQLDIHGERVVVWGAGTGGSYVEAFDRETGRNVFRFYTEYWNADRRSRM